MNDVKLKDAMVLDGLWCPENDVHMAVIGGSVAQNTTSPGKCKTHGPLAVRNAGRKGNKTTSSTTSVSCHYFGKKGDTVISKDEAPRRALLKKSLKNFLPLRQRRHCHRRKRPGTDERRFRHSRYESRKSRRIRSAYPCYPKTTHKCRGNPAISLPYWDYPFKNFWIKQLDH